MLQNSTQAKTKQRHGCLTAYLTVLVFGGVIILIFFLLRGLAPSNTLPVWAVLASSVFIMFSIACGIAIFMWKKWGVWGLCAGQLLDFIVRIIEKETVFGSLIILIVSIGLLFLVLTIGKENKGWPQLE